MHSTHPFFLSYFKTLYYFRVKNNISSQGPLKLNKKFNALQNLVVGFG